MGYYDASQWELVSHSLSVKDHSTNRQVSEKEVSLFFKKKIYYGTLNINRGRKNASISDEAHAFLAKSKMLPSNIQ